MTIKTLNYIHQLLLANLESAKVMYRNARDRLNEMEDFLLQIDEEGDARESYTTSISNQKEYVNDCFEKYSAASEALDDFEGKMW